MDLYAVLAEDGLGSLNHTVLETFTHLDEAHAYLADPPDWVTGGHLGVYEMTRLPNPGEEVIW